MIEDLKANNQINNYNQLQVSYPFQVPPPLPGLYNASLYSNQPQIVTQIPISTPIPQPTVSQQLVTTNLPQDVSVKAKDQSEELNVNEESSKLIDPDKKQKNRVSAQKCRMRKKQYIESLEAKIEQLNIELSKCKEEIKLLKESQAANLVSEGNLNAYVNKYNELLVALHNNVVTNQPTGIYQKVLEIINVTSNIYHSIITEEIAQVGAQ